MNRRKFLQTTASALAVSAVAHVAGAQDQKPLRAGLIGTGWYGKCDLFRLIQVSPGVEVVSLCDVDKKMLANAADMVATRQSSRKKPRQFADYREMLKEKDLDVCLVGTPDHWHALAMIAACQAGADVYVQKPISVDITEGQAMLAAARKYNRVVQVGTQRRSTPHLVEARDRVVKPGLLGNIAYVEICCYYHMRNNSNPPEQDPPANLDWEMWTGPAPMRPYVDIAHPKGWRSFMEYGNGIIGDMCIHMLDTARWMMDLGWAKNVSSTGGILVQKNARSNISDTQEAAFDFGDVKVVWTHRTWGSSPDAKYPWAVIFYGDKGTLKASVNGYEFFPQGAKEARLSGQPLFEYEKHPEDRDEKDLERHVASAIRWHMLDFLKCRELRDAAGPNGTPAKRPVADIEQGHISTTACCLANMSMQLGRSLKWDPEKHQVVGDEEANRLLARPYRAPWTHPTPQNV
jgi:predicted dehydrogenase